MSLQVDGVWKGGVWAPTIWAAGVWYEPEVAAVAVGSGGDDAIDRRELTLERTATRRRREEKEMLVIIKIYLGMMQ